MTHSIFRSPANREKKKLFFYLPMLVDSFASAIFALNSSNSFALSSLFSLHSAIAYIVQLLCTFLNKKNFLTRSRSARNFRACALCALQKTKHY